MTGMSTPRVSVLLPVFNAAAELPRALDSILRQRMAEWECVVADDGSEDDTPALVARYAERDPRVRLLRLPHAGIVPALNVALEASRGTHVARMDGDDVSHPDRLGIQADFLDDRPEVTVASCLLRKFPRQALRIGMLRYEGWLNSLVDSRDIARDIYVESPLCHPTVMMRRRELLALGGYRDVPWPEDYDLWLRVHHGGGSIAKVPRFLFCWREHEQRLSRVSERYGPDAFRRCKIAFLAQGPLRGHRRVVVWGAGRTGKRMAQALLQADYEVAAFVDLDPRKIGMAIYGVPVIAPPQVPPYRGIPILAAVGKDGARDDIRGRLAGMRFEEGRDYWCVA